MINWNRKVLEDCGFKYQKTLVETTHDFHYEGKILKYILVIDDENNQVSVSGDNTSPFGSESIFEFYVPCKLIVFKSSDEIDYRLFHFSFYNSDEATEESLRLTISGRKSDGELVVWPNFYWN
jgi:hypothetical protein